MKTISNLLISLILATWVAAIAIVSVQNYLPVSLKFFIWQSIQLPFGVVLAFSAALGIIAGAIVPFLWRIFSFPNQ